MHILKDLSTATLYKKPLLTNDQYDALRPNLKQFYRYIAPVDVPNETMRALPIDKEKIKLFHEPLKLNWYQDVRTKR